VNNGGGATRDDVASALPVVRFPCSGVPPCPWGPHRSRSADIGGRTCLRLCAAARGPGEVFLAPAVRPATPVLPTDLCGPSLLRRTASRHLNGRLRSTRVVGPRGPSKAMKGGIARRATAAVVSRPVMVARPRVAAAARESAWPSAAAATRARLAVASAASAGPAGRPPRIGR